MPTLTIEYRDEYERLALEQAITYLTDLRQLARQAPNGNVLDACEQLVLDKGRALLRSTFAAALQGRIQDAEQKGGRPVAVPRRTPHARRVATHAPSSVPSDLSPCDVTISSAPRASKGNSPPTASSASTAI